MANPEFITDCCCLQQTSENGWDCMDPAAYFPSCKSVILSSCPCCEKLYSECLFCMIKKENLLLRTVMEICFRFISWSVTFISVLNWHSPTSEVKEVYFYNRCISLVRQFFFCSISQREEKTSSSHAEKNKIRWNSLFYQSFFNCLESGRWRRALFLRHKNKLRNKYNSNWSIFLKEKHLKFLDQIIVTVYGWKKYNSHSCNR